MILYTAGKPDVTVSTNTVDFWDEANSYHPLLHYTYYHGHTLHVLSVGTVPCIISHEYTVCHTLDHKVKDIYIMQESPTHRCTDSMAGESGHSMASGH